MALLKDELAQITARSGVLRAGTGRSGDIVSAVRLQPSTGRIIWVRAIDPKHVLTPYNQGQPPNAADTAVYTTYRS